MEPINPLYRGQDADLRFISEVKKIHIREFYYLMCTFESSTY